MALSLPPSLTSLFRHTTPPLFGLDISASGVKLVELSAGAKGEPKLERYAIETLERGAVVDGNIENLDAVADAVRKALRSSGTRCRNVAMALPSSAVITKRIALPAGLREEELELQVESEANQYIPFAIDEVNLDFQVLGPTINNPDDVDVLLAATRKEKVEDRVAIAEMCGLKALVMDVESYAARSAIDNFVRLLPNAGQGQVVAVFDIGQVVTQLSVSLNGQPVFEREQAFGGSQLTQDIVRGFGLTPEEAEQKKRQGGLPDNYERDMLQPFVEHGALELTRALQFFFTSTPYTRVDHVLLAGGTSVTPGLIEAVASRTQVPTRLMNPFYGMDTEAVGKPRQLPLDAPALMVATGLAMRRFDPS